MRDVSYPSPWPRYLVMAALAAAGLGTAHLFAIGFAHWAAAHPGPALRHVLTLEYARPAGILLRCSAVVVAGSGSAAMRGFCRQWFDAASWYAGRYGPGYLTGGAVAAALTAGWVFTASRARLRMRESDRRATSRFSTAAELVPFTASRTPAARPEAGALPLGRTVGGGGVPGGLELGLPYPQRFQHVWVLGVTGAGKTSSAFKRWVAADAELDGCDRRLAMSSVVVDVKHPDIFTAIAPVALRRRRRVYVWAPFDESGTTMAVNALDYVPFPMDPQTAASLILSNMPDYARRDPFWRGVERQLLTLLIQLVIEEPAEAFASPALRAKVRHILQLRPDDPLPQPRSLAFVLALSYLSVEEFTRLFDTWPQERAATWRDRFATIQSAEERTIVGGMLGIQQALAVFAERPVVLSTSVSTFRLETLAFQPTTLVIGLPTHPRPNRQVLTSLFLRQLLDVLGRLGEQRRPQGLPVPVTLYLDEIGTLGYIGNLPDYIATYRDIGVSFVLATQDTQQLSHLFGTEQAEVLVANLHTRVVFGHDLRPEQAARISQDLGERVVAEPQADYRGGALSQRLAGARLVYQVRPLMAPGELRGMPPFEAVVVLPGDRKARVYMEPVHLDRRFPKPLHRPLSWLHLYRHNALLDDLIGPPPHLDGGEPPPPPPPAPAAQAAAGALDEPAAFPATDAAASAAPVPSPDGAGSPAAAGGREEAAAALTPEGEDARPRDGSGAAGEGSPQEAASGASPAEGHLVAFFRALLAGQLHDERVPDGVPGFVYTDRRGAALVPWGYFMDYGRKEGLRFVALNARWVAEQLVGPRVTVMHQGRAVTCMTFTRQACRMLPADVQREVARRFRRVSPETVRPSAQHAPARAADGPQGEEERVAGGGGEAEAGREGADGLGALPFLAECLALVRRRAAEFEGHPDYAEGGPALGRWRHTTKDGEELLLVRRDVLEEEIARLGGRPEVVFALWKGAWVLRPGEGDRPGYRLKVGEDRAYYLAFRWPLLRTLGFPAGDTERRAAGASVRED